MTEPSKVDRRSPRLRPPKLRRLLGAVPRWRCCPPVANGQPAAPGRWVLAVTGQNRSADSPACFVRMITGSLVTDRISPASYGHRVSTKVTLGTECLTSKLTHTGGIHGVLRAKRPAQIRPCVTAGRHSALCSRWTLTVLSRQCRVWLLWLPPMVQAVALRSRVGPGAPALHRRRRPSRTRTRDAGSGAAQVGPDC